MFKINSIDLNQAIRNLQALQQLSSGEQQFLSEENAQEINDQLSSLVKDTMKFEAIALNAKTWFRITLEENEKMNQFIKEIEDGYGWASIEYVNNMYEGGSLELLEVKNRMIDKGLLWDDSDLTEIDIDMVESNPLDDFDIAPIQSRLSF